VPPILKLRKRSNQRPSERDSHKLWSFPILHIRITGACPWSSWLGLLTHTPVINYSSLTHGPVHFMELTGVFQH